jgi:prepilin-type N-terminal cleavage/methylation domain-containing protein
LLDVAKRVRVRAGAGQTPEVSRNPLRVARRRFAAGYSLLELIAVVAILGIMACMTYAMMTTDVLGNHGADATARQLALDLELARREAIATGINHWLQLSVSGGQVTAYQIYRTNGGSSIAVDTLRAIPEHVTVTISPSGSTTPAFTFEGQAASTFTFTLAGASRTWQVAVTAATGRARVIEP